MSRKIVVLAGLGLVSSMLLSYPSIGASGGNVTLQGNVTEQTCAASGSSENLSVDLGMWSTAQLNGGAGKTTSPRPFTLSLEGCPVGPLNIIFTGTVAAGSNDLLALDEGSESAKNVAIELLDSDMTHLGLAAASLPVTADEEGNASFNFYARYISIASQVGAGQANASSLFTITYN